MTKGSGNVFRDLGFSEQKSAELTLKSSLLQALQGTIKGRGWKQIEAAAQLGIDQAKVSKLLAGQHSIRINDQWWTCLHRQTGPLRMRTVVDGRGKEV